MTLIISRASLLAVLTAFASAFQPHHASAQAADAPTRPSLLAVNATVPAGAVVDVTDIQGKTVTGVLGSVTSEFVEVTVKDKTRTFFARDVHRIRWRQRDSWVTGAVIGAGLGAVPGSIT
jgi:hypothetical protein